MSDQHMAREAAKKAASLPPPKSPSPSAVLKSGVLGGLLLASAAVGVVVFVVSRKAPTPQDAPAAVHSVAASGSPSTPAPLNVNGVAIPTPSAVDPTDMLPAAKRRMAEPERELSLVSIEVAEATQGAVNLETPGAQIVYRFLSAPERPRMKRDQPPPAEVVTLALGHDPPPIARAEVGARDRPVIEPTCVWSAAWRAAVASGIAASEPVHATFRANASTGANTWVFTPKNRPEMSTEIDGQSCAIKAR